MVNDKLQTIRVYRGDNERQDFWESGNGEIIILRVKYERSRTVGRTRVRSPWVAFRRQQITDTPLLFEDLEETKLGRFDGYTGLIEETKQETFPFSHILRITGKGQVVAYHLTAINDVLGIEDE
jgi:hypothetical protein